MLCGCIHTQKSTCLLWVLDKELFEEDDDTELVPMRFTLSRNSGLILSQISVIHSLDSATAGILTT